MYYIEQKHREEFMKIKHMHELELTRCIRENEKLSKLLIRATGSKSGVGVGIEEENENSPWNSPSKKSTGIATSGSRNDNSKSLNDSAVLKSKLRQLQLEKEEKLNRNSGVNVSRSGVNSTHHGGDETLSEIEYPPPPPSLSSLPTTNNHNHAAAMNSRNGVKVSKFPVNTGSADTSTRPGVSKWDQLNRSLLQEQQYVDMQLKSQIHQTNGNANMNTTVNSANTQHLLKNMHTASTIPPPESFHVEDAYAHTMIGKERNSTYVSDNMSKVNTYMSKLQNYLTEYDIEEGVDSSTPEGHHDSNPLLENIPHYSSKVNDKAKQPQDMYFGEDDLVQQEELDASLLEDSLDEEEEVMVKPNRTTVHSNITVESTNKSNYPHASLKSYVTIPQAKEDKFNTTDQLLGSDASQDNVTMNSEILKLLNDNSY